MLLVVVVCGCLLFVVSRLGKCVLSVASVLLVVCLFVVCCLLCIAARGLLFAVVCLLSVV